MQRASTAWCSSSAMRAGRSTVIVDGHAACRPEWTKAVSVGSVGSCCRLLAPGPALVVAEGVSRRLHAPLWATREGSGPGAQESLLPQAGLAWGRVWAQLKSLLPTGRSGQAGVVPLL